MSLAHWLVGSNAFYVLAGAWIWWIGKFPKYYAQVTLMWGMMILSGFYHACLTDAAIHYCPDTSPEVGMARDIMAAFQSIVAVTVLVDEWAWSKLPARTGAKALAYHYTLTSLATTFFVVQWQDGLITTITLPVVHGLVLLAAFAIELNLGGAAYKLLGVGEGGTGMIRHTLWWWMAVLFGTLCLAGGIAFRVVSMNEYSSATAPHQTDVYEKYHAAWHALCGFGAFLLFLVVTPDTAAYAAVPTREPPPKTATRSAADTNMLLLK